MTRNLHRVPKKQWRKWSDRARHAFNEIYCFAMKNPDIMLHRLQPKLKPFHWKVIAWNFALIAADAVDGYTEISLEDDRVRTWKAA